MTQTRSHIFRRPGPATAATTGTAPPAAPPAVEPASELHVNLQRLRANLAQFRRVVGRRVRLCAVIKKDAYGLGATSVGPCLADAGCDMLAVYDEQEASQLLGAGLAEREVELLVMGPVWDVAPGPVADAAGAGRLHLSIHEPGQVHALAAAAARLDARLPVHVFLDTGMSRSGLEPGHLPSVVTRIRHERHLRLAGIYSHLATAEQPDDFAERQLKRFQAALADAGRLRRITRHLANTCATLRSDAFHLDMVRVGLGLLGYGPDRLAGPRCVDADFALKPTVRWTSRLIQLRWYPPGAAIGYGQTHRMDRPSLLGLVPVGYGDGYPVALGNRATVAVRLDGRWRDAPVRGRVNMDQITVDLTDAAAHLPTQEPATLDALRGGAVELVSDDPAAPHALPRLAALADTHCYDLLCRMRGRRVHTW